MIAGRRVSLWALALGAILLLGLVLRLKGLHNPIIDHPGWRQGDEAAIARNFATLQFNPLYPQTDYNGPPPNYVELELQIVPFLAATLYKLFGIHEVFGRLLSIAFGLGTIAVLTFFARWLFADALAGLVAGFLFAVMPGSIYYGRTFTPDTAMVFFLVAALYAGARYFVNDEVLSWRGCARAGGLLTFALLAKPVAAVALLPLGALAVERVLSGRTLRLARIALCLLAPILILYAYDRFESSVAEWHWASGIVKLHVVPSLRAALTDGSAFAQKWQYLRDVLVLLSRTMVGAGCLALMVLGFLFPAPMRSRSLLWTWLLACAIYAYVVVTVERVDYYLYPILPLAALAGTAFILRLTKALDAALPSATAKRAALGAALVLAIILIVANRNAIKPYYAYSATVYRNARALNATLAPGALIVMGHYDPSVLYYINRKGWEEDPYLWTPFDEQSAIRKGARYFVTIERNRFQKNVELYNWMQRFPVINPNAKWLVYESDPAKVVPGAEERWRKFRSAEKAGRASQFMPRHH